MPRDPYLLPPDRRPTERLPEVDAPPTTRRAIEEAKAFARTAENNLVTMVRCPLCRACGLVTPDIAATFDELCRKAAEQT